RDPLPSPTRRSSDLPEDGYYALVLEGAACDDPQAGCLIGGMPWLLVEEGAREPGRRRGPDPTVEPGGEPLPLGPIAWPTHTPPPDRKSTRLNSSHVK